MTVDEVMDQLVDIAIRQADGIDSYHDMVDLLTRAKDELIDEELDAIQQFMLMMDHRLTSFMLERGMEAPGNDPKRPN
jgi:hypothetical protein